VNYFTDPVGQIFATVATFDSRQAKKEGTELPFVIEEVDSKSEQ